MRTALLIVNHRGGTAATELDPAVEILRARGIEVLSFEPDDPAQIDGLIDEHAGDADLIILGGGDGTLSFSTEAVLRADRPLGILPLGTANDFARSLQIPNNLEQAAMAIAEGETLTVDVGLVDGRPFLNVATIGFAAEVARFHSGQRKRYLRLLSYPLSWLDAYRSNRSFGAQIVCDGKTIRRRCAQLAVGSGRHYGGGLTISESAQVDDGWLRVYHVRPLGFWDWLRLLPSFRLGTLDKHREAGVIRARVVDVETSRRKAVNVDGELIAHTPVKFGVLPRALKVFAPRPAATGNRITEGEEFAS